MAAGEERRRKAVLSRVRRVQRQLNLEVWFEAAVAPAWAAATAVIVGRVMLPFGFEAFAAMMIILALLAMALRAQPRRVTIDQASVVADRLAGSGGLLLTRLETPVGEWELGLNQRLKTLPSPRIDIAAPTRWLVLCVLFTVAGFLVPRMQHAPKAVNLAAASRVDQLADKVEALQAEEPVPEQLEAELARLQAEVERAKFDDTDWEASDSLEKSLDAQAAKRSKALGEAEAAAAKVAAAELAAGQDAEATRQERDALEQALMKLGDTNGKPSEGANGQPGDKPGSHSPASSKSNELRDALGKRREELAKAFGQKPGSALRPFDRAQGEGRQGRGEGRQGRGEGQKGVGDGHGDAPPAELILRDEANIDPDRLSFAPLPAGHDGDETGELLGLRSADPKVKPSAPTSSSGTAAKAGATTGHREAPLLPRNRALIERYFETH